MKLNITLALAMAAFASAAVVPEEEFSPAEAVNVLEARKGCSGSRKATDECGGKLLRAQNSFHNCGNQGGKCCAENKDGSGGINVGLGGGSEHGSIATIFFAYDLVNISGTKLNAIVAVALLATTQAAQKFTHDDLVDYIDDFQKCELQCWDSSATTIECSSSDLDCVCKDAGTDFIFTALSCWGQAQYCGATTVQSVHFDDMCKFLHYGKPSDSSNEDAQKHLSERLADPDMEVTLKPASPTASATGSGKPGASASNTATGASTSKTPGASSTDKKSAAGVVGVSFGVVGVAGLAALL
ncbi:hypothetical protein NLG97_g6004 [Lecanicillium saksenae]|uniref:Uncharacterized protein n=1 Tax=Lecanicillium saksenae TaxID=468837 RepID=A0ACC1QQU6_9HYPO|nr:hypothetical protein NLG97_g6004 [Lecanicillium saksenae]